MKGLKINPCRGCRNNCLRINLLCRIGFDFELQCWRNQFEPKSFGDFWRLCEHISVQSEIDLVYRNLAAKSSSTLTVLEVL